MNVPQRGGGQDELAPGSRVARGGASAPSVRPRQISVELANSAKSVPLARSVVIDLLRRNGGDSAVDVAGLLTSELVTNAVIHSATSVGLLAILSEHRLRVEASDRSPTAPVVRTAAPDDTSGRGLVVVASLSTEWGYEMHPTGKSVWFELAL